MEKQSKGEHVLTVRLVLCECLCMPKCHRWHLDRIQDRVAVCSVYDFSPPILLL